ncbi:hypothetical protein [Bartonella sp. CB178]|uniref:hypothetical protein n=1 Tax=Bartonella sp. CB178 TaxID=3112255 RepID=UPI00300DC544
MSTSIDALCDSWIALFHLCNDDRLGDNDCNAIVKTMSVIENTLVLKLQDEVPNVIKTLAVLTDFGSSEFPQVMEPFLKAYDPNLKSFPEKAA